MNDIVQLEWKTIRQRGDMPMIPVGYRARAKAFFPGERAVLKLFLKKRFDNYCRCEAAPIGRLRGVRLDIFVFCAIIYT